MYYEPQIEAELDSEPQTEAESDLESTQDEQGSTQNQFVGTSFRAGRDITVSRARFRNIITVHPAAPGPPSDFRRIRIGDLDLRNEIRLVESGEVYRNHGRRCVRRIYSARIHGSKSKMTATVYQGENTEKEWREDVAQYSWLRHPNIVQLFGIASACGIHAAILNDELIPVQQLFEKHSGSHLRTVYLWYLLSVEFDDAYKYIRSVSGTGIPRYCTKWIRLSTGQLCVDPTDNAHSSIYLYHLDADAPSSSAVSVLELLEDSRILDSISLDDYHEICSLYFEHCHRPSPSMNASVQLGAVILCPPGSEHPNEIAYIPDLDVVDYGWSASTAASLTVLESGWTRVDSSKVSDGYFSRLIGLENKYKHESAWISQANHIFHCLGITSNHDDYLFVQWIYYTLRVATSDSIPPGYLFLCPLVDLEADSPSHFQLAECLAYWSLDPTGDDQLSMEEAEHLGFPTFELEIEVLGESWDESVYNGTRQFYQAKNFDPDSQDIARKLGLPLFEISTEVDGPFAHIQEIHVYDHSPETQEAPDSELPQDGESALHFLPDQPVASSFATTHQTLSFDAYPQGTTIGDSFDLNLFESAARNACRSENFNNLNFNFEFPFRDQPYHLQLHEPTTPSQFAHPDVAESSFNYPGLCGAQFTTPPPALWSAFPCVPPVPAPSPPPRPSNPIAAYLDQLPASGSGKRKSRDDDPTNDSGVYARRLSKMPKRSDL